MPSSGLFGPYALNAESISQHIEKKSPGAYALGEYSNGTFHISRIGRSDVDVGKRLTDYVGDYKHFKFDFMESKKAAFEKECSLYHDFTPPDNDIHPDRPAGTDWSCPRCKVFD